MPFSPFTVHPSQGSNSSPFTLHHSRGFTVVELSVVLIVIGLVFVGVLKLEQVYRNYKIRNVINQYRELTTTIKVYRDKFGYLPGDDPYASTHVGTNPAWNGNGNDMINPSGNPVAEYIYGNLEMRSAGLIARVQSNNTLSQPFGRVDFIGNFHKPTTGAVYQRNELMYYTLPAEVAQAIDTALDDGNYATGMVRGNKWGASYIDPLSGISYTTLEPYSYTNSNPQTLLMTIFIE